jgi:hypothetical protein
MKLSGLRVEPDGNALNALPRLPSSLFGLLSVVLLVAVVLELLLERVLVLLRKNLLGNGDCVVVLCRLRGRVGSSVNVSSPGDDDLLVVFCEGPNAGDHGGVASSGVERPFVGGGGLGLGLVGRGRSGRGGDGVWEGI